MAKIMTSGGTVQAVYTLTTYGGEAIAGGIFDGIDGVGSGNVAKWNGPTDVRSIGDRTPTEFTLHENYPNPFNPSTTIQFDLPRSLLVSMRVFNILGQEVATLVNKEMHPGSYSVTWNAPELPSGVYYCRMEAGPFSQTKKILLVR